jgi:nitrite reductase/ring-hydroxylating ferredoxin subunit
MPKTRLAPLRGAPLPAEGDDGLFSQSWFPICLSGDVPPASVQSFSFLDGRVAVFRDSEGEARVLSAYCPHLGADLGLGEVVNGALRCAFHHWSFDPTGRCVATGIGDPPPPRAELFAFPTKEKFGLVWAFNGEEALWELPDFPYPEEALTVRTLALEELLPVDPWVLCCNTPDIQHIKALHGITFEGEDPEAEWSEFSMLYNFKGFHKAGEVIDNRVGIYGTSLFYQSTDFAGKWFGFLAPFGIPTPGRVQTFFVVAARRDLGPPEEVEAFLDFVVDLERKVVGEDIPIMRTIRFRPGALTKSDKTLGRFFRYLRSYPRAHPAAEHIR